MIMEGCVQLNGKTIARMNWSPVTLQEHYRLLGRSKAAQRCRKPQPSGRQCAFLWSCFTGRLISQLAIKPEINQIYVSEALCVSTFKLFENFAIMLFVAARRYENEFLKSGIDAHFRNSNFEQLNSRIEQVPTLLGKPM